MGKSPKEWRLFFATDIHGSTVCFKKFLNARKHYGADVLIMGGDITGKILVPIARNGSRTYGASFMGERHAFRSRTEVDHFSRWVEDRGAYAYVCEMDELDDLSVHPENQERLFSKLICNRMTQWVELADERLRGDATTVLFNAGNDDAFEIDGIIDQSKSMIRPEGQVVELKDGVVCASCGYANDTPWQCPRDVSEEQLRATLGPLVRGIADPSTSVFNFHCPPRETCLDQAPRLDDELRPQLTGFGIEMESVGSSAVREVIESFQPALTLHGHVHESRGITRIGKTVSVNPGSEYQEGILNGVIADFKNGYLHRAPVLTSG